MENKNCENCKTEITNNYNFCPSCGKALTTIAESIKKEEKRGAMLEVVLTLANKLEDPKDLDILNSLLKKLKP